MIIPTSDKVKRITKASLKALIQGFKFIGGGELLSLILLAYISPSSFQFNIKVAEKS